VADLANAGWYAAEGDYANAALSAAGAIPFVGWGAAAIKGGKSPTSAPDTPTPYSSSTLTPTLMNWRTSPRATCHGRPLAG
jgi:hypothetical protein